MREFWIRKHWPNDPSGYVFLARALGEMGRARFGEEWTGTEFLLEAPQVLPMALTSRLGDCLRARSLLRKQRPDIELAPSTPGNKFVLPTAPITPEQWKVAREISLLKYDAVKPFLIRRSIVEAELVRQCEAKRIASFYRPLEGGEMHVIPSTWWNTEGTARFAMCQLSPQKPFGWGISGDGYAWIFISRESLDRYVTGQPFATVAAGIEGHLSPYLKVMLAVSRTLAITRANQPKKEVVVAELRKAWTGPVPLSAKLIEAMATLLREPESQLGRAVKKK